MQHVTPTTTSPVGTLPPPTLVRPTPPNLISQAPTLPSLAPAAPKPASAPPSNPFATSMNPTPPPRTPSRPPGAGGARRFFSWLLLLAALAGVGYAAYRFGPELIDRTAGETIDEPEAPRTFPETIAAPVRTATYVVERPTGPAGDVPQTYTMTTDFESGLAQLTIDGGDAPDIEMKAVFDEGVVRRVDEPTWYRLPRGDFPVDSSLGRGRWVRTIDELVPPGLRSIATIERSTESMVGDVPARRLLLSVDAPRFAAMTAPGTGTVVMPPGVALAPDADLTAPLEIEIWVDDSGLVRKQILPAQLGGETITVTSVTADPFQTDYPTPDLVQPLTAQALLSLGL